ncbi:hypothetical protein DFQ14_102604 [Halopolyspora algeriensis]|uniref:Uncharacterized protein n=1 Tax=Halopolyspora algeriensis TaxID=1500506 RepID=A0A368W130_9ACTN|nr:GNAT family N-acetyltransferase [Halopolyspora algeriensis]RCW46301.1 hypothetical protein DFQ14_102604 [Halopolyspora algeriensis]TQM55701.1 hypothetical protein FHU43_0477 [Halopolyspora algeriensis]
MEPKVIDNPERARFEVHADEEVAGFAEYRTHQQVIELLHTEVDSRFEGRGLGSLLIGGVLDTARQRELAVLPYCPFIRGWIGKHPEYVDLVPQDRRSEFEL